MEMSSIISNLFINVPLKAHRS